MYINFALYFVLGVITDVLPHPLLVEPITRRSLRLWRKERVRLPIFVLPKRGYMRMEVPDMEDDDGFRPEPLLRDAVDLPDFQSDPTTSEKAPASNVAELSRNTLSTTPAPSGSTSATDVTLIYSTSRSSEFGSSKENGPTTEVMLDNGEEMSTISTSTDDRTTTQEVDTTTVERSVSTPAAKTRNSHPLPRLEELFPGEVTRYRVGQVGQAVIVSGKSQVYQNPGSEESPTGTTSRKELKVIMAVPVQSTPQNSTATKTGNLGGEEAGLLVTGRRRDGDGTPAVHAGDGREVTSTPSPEPDNDALVSTTTTTLDTATDTSSPPTTDVSEDAGRNSTPTSHPSDVGGDGRKNMEFDGNSGPDRLGTSTLAMTTAQETVINTSEASSIGPETTSTETEATSTAGPLPDLNST